jgi:hypothetical protein
VHLTCYRCGKEYFVHQENLSPPKLVSGKGYGWWMWCSHCDYEWWQSQPVDHMPINSGPGEVRPNHSPSTQNTFLGPIKQTGVDYEFAPRPSRSRVPPPRFGVAYSSEKTSRTVVVIWVCFLLCLLAIAGLAYQYQEGVVNFFQRQFFLIYNPTPSPRVESVEPTPNHQPAPQTPQQEEVPNNTLSLENVKYGVQTSESGEKTLVILGEIFNETTHVIPLKPLKIVGFGPCSEGEVRQTPEGLCVKAEWTYEWSRPNILPRERLFFQADRALESTIEIQRVEVTIP